MPSPSQPLITLPLSDRLRTYIQLKCLKIIKVNEKPAAKIKQFRCTNGELIFKLNVSIRPY